MDFIFDENMPIRLAKGLEIMDSENDWGKAPKNKFYHITEIYKKGKGADDPEIVREAKKINAIVISEDDDYKNIKATHELVIKLRVGYILFKPPKKTGSTYHEIVAAFVNSWHDLKKELVGKRPPFMFIVERNGKVTNYEKFKAPHKH